MAGGYTPPPRDSVGVIVDAVQGNKKRVGNLERPDATSIASLVLQVKTAIAGIATLVTAQVTAAMGAYSTTTDMNSAINSKVANPGAISPTSVSASGAVSGSSVSSSGDVNATNALRGSDVYATNAPGFNITGTRVAGWWESATGRGGTATSSQRFKTDVEAFPLDKARAMLNVVVSYFSYKAEVAKRDDPSSPDYVGPDYHVATNLGGIAEQFHAAGLWELVVYERDADNNLILDASGDPVPYALHDILMAYPLITLAQSFDERLAAIEAKLGIGDNS